MLSSLKPSLAWMSGFSVEFTENLGGTCSLLLAYPLSLWKPVYEASSHRKATQEERTCIGCRGRILHHSKPVSTYVVSYDLELKGRLYAVTSNVTENGKGINSVCIFFYVYTSFVSVRSIVIT